MIATARSVGDEPAIWPGRIQGANMGGIVAAYHAAIARARNDTEREFLTASAETTHRA